MTFRRIGVFAVLRKLHVLIDGQPRLTLRYGQSAVVELGSGVHVVRTSMDWCSSNELQFNCRPGEAKFIDCGSQPLLAAALYCLVAPRRVFLVSEATGEPRPASYPTGDALQPLRTLRMDQVGLDADFPYANAVLFEGTLDELPAAVAAASRSQVSRT